MSVINSAAHNVISYVSGVTKPFTGQRLATITYKTIKDSSNPLCNVKRESKAVSLPVLEDSSITGNIAVLMPHVKAMLYAAQDKIIREYLDSGANVSLIPADVVSISAVVEYLDNSNESGRLTKEVVSKWFDETVSESLMLALAEKLGVSETPSNEESMKIEAIVSGFREKVSALAGGKTSYEPKLCESLKKCIALAPADDMLAGRFIVRLDKMIASASDSVGLLDAL